MAKMCRCWMWLLLLISVSSIIDCKYSTSSFVMASESCPAFSGKKPKVLVFDLDYTLWPFWVDTNFDPPFRKGKNNIIVDASEEKVQSFPEVSDILKKLHEEGYEIGIASRTSEIKGANQLIELFGWNKYIKYKEIYPGSKIPHFKKIKEASGVNYEDMIFFDDEHRNIYDITGLGVLSILVVHGVTKKVIEDAFAKFKSR